MNYKTTEQKVVKFIKKNKLINAENKILVALSGGADSVFLLVFLYKFQKLFKISLAAAHINHSLRGKEANKDQSYSKILCDKFDIPFYTKRVYVKSFASKNKISIEEAARKLRYSSLKKIAKEINADKIATAHNIDDNAETVLFNLTRGTGVSGMAGIPFQRENIIRPILVLSKVEIIQYLEKQNIKYVTDSTNLDNSFSRNFIRNEILQPIRENLNPSVSEAILKFSELFKNHSKLISSLLQEIEKKFTTYENNTLKISLSIVSQHNDFIIGELLKSIFQKYFCTEFNYNDFIKLSELFNKQRGKQVKFKNGITAFRESDSILFFAKDETTDFDEKIITLGNFAETKNGKLHISDAENKNITGKSNKLSELISGDNLEDIFILRRWKNGDKFIPLGMNNFKKISNFLSEQKVQSNIKKDQLVLTNGNKIVWVVGQRLDNRFKILKNTRKVVKLWIA